MSEGQDWGAKRAAAYDKRIREIFPAYEQLHANALALAQYKVCYGGSILVVGSGTGFEALTLGRAGFEVTAIDPSAEMLNVGRAQAQPSLSVEFQQVALEDLPVTPDFDAVTSLLVMHFLPDDGTKLNFLSESAKRCRSGGTLILADLVGEPGTPEFDQDFQAFEDSLAERSTEGQLARDMEAIRRDVHFMSVRRLQELMVEAGWVNPTLEWQAGLLNLWSATRV